LNPRFILPYMRDGVQRIWKPDTARHLHGALFSNDLHGAYGKACKRA
jgi:hypothetical protein